MDNSLVHFSTILMAFFAIMNPIANTPLFVALTNDVDSGMKKKIAIRSIALAFVIITVFAFAGRTIFDVFGITLPAFRIAGGALIALVGYHMLQGEQSSVHHPSEDDKAKSNESALDIAITPLALPVLAGPGTIATAMNFAADSTMPEIIRVVGALAVICALTLISFLMGGRITNFLGQNAIKVITRLMGLILAVIGVQMLVVGINSAIKIT